MSGKARTQTDWQMHHRLVGEIAQRASKMVSNTAKAEVLAAMDEIEARLKREWVENAKRNQEAERAATGPKSWADLPLEE